MADRQSSDPTQRQTPRSHLQGLSLTDFGGNFNFGPTLLPTSAAPVVLGNQPTSGDTPLSNRATSELEKKGEEDNFLMQQPPLQRQSPLPKQNTGKESVTMSEGHPQGSTFFTMSSPSEAHDDFLSSETSTQGSMDAQVQSDAVAGSQTPPRLPGSLPPSLAKTPERPASGWPPTPSHSTLPTNWSQTPSQSSWSNSTLQSGSTWPSSTVMSSSSPAQIAAQSSPSYHSAPHPTYSQSSPPHDISPSPTPPQVHSSPVPGPIPSVALEPVNPHWFYRKGNSVWVPFSYIDSECLEQALRMPSSNEDRVVPTDGGRYDVNLDKRLRYPLYWEESVSVVRRCTWFYKGDGEAKLVPYMEDMALRLETEFQFACRENKWPRRVELKDGEYIMMHNTNVMVHFCPNNESESWSGEDIVARPKVVRRSVVDIEDEIEDGEPAQIDHLIFVVHGIGPIADLNFRNIIECVDDLRKVSLQMLRDHHEELSSGRAIGRVEFLPVQWHSRLHNDSTGVDKRLQSISLGSIHRLREFTNSTLVDILFYTSPTYCQTIVNTVGDEIKRLLEIFKKRNPMFNGQYSVCGHSLGSSILFDILLHQNDERGKGSSAKQTSPLQQAKETLDAGWKTAVRASPDTLGECRENSDVEEEEEEDEKDSYPPLGDALTQLGLPEYVGLFESEEMDMETFLLCSEEDIKEMGIPMGPRKKLMTYMRSQRQIMEKKKLEREERRRAKAEAKAKAKVDQQESRNTIEKEQSNPQLELMSSTLLFKPDLGVQKSGSSLTSVESVEVVYQQGLAGTGQPYVEYPQLDLSLYAFFALGSPIGMFLTVRGVDEIGLDFQFPTCPRLFNVFHPFDPVAYRIEPLVNPSVTAGPVLMPHHKGRKRMHIELRENLSRLGANLKQSLIESARKTWESIHEFARAHSAIVPDALVEEASEVEEDSSTEALESKVEVGRLNGGQRIDYVLQEKPIESLNEYLFALGSHVCYWVSEDTALFMLKEIYRV